MEEAPSTKKSKTEENEAKHARSRQNTGGKLGARTVHPRTNTAGRPEIWHGQAVLVWHDRATWHGETMPLGTAVPSGAARFVRSQFFAFLNAFSLHFWGPLLNLLESIFRVELGFILSLNKPHYGDLD